MEGGMAGQNAMNAYGAQQGQIGRQGVGQYIGAVAANAPNAPVTLASAISGFDGLHSRLSELVSKAHQLASVVGGPFPMNGGDPKAQPIADSAVRRLNETSGDCHRKVDHLNECLDAMARSLGA